MQKRINHFLNAPFPLFLAHHKGQIYFFRLIPILTLALIILEPFGYTSWHEYHKWMIVCGYVITFTGTYVLVYQIRFYFFPKYHQPDNWTRGKELLGLLFYFPLSAFTTWIFALISIEKLEISLNSFFKIQKYNSSISVLTALLFGYFISTKLNPIHKAKKEVTISQSIEAEERAELPSNIRINGLTLVVNDICYVESRRNDLHFWILHNGELKEIATRYTLKKLESDLMVYTQFLRCQNSFMVNMVHLKNWNIANDKMVVHPKYCTRHITVRRDKSEEIKEILRKNYIFKAK